MPVTALALFGLFVVGPPTLPPDIGDVPSAEDPPASEQQPDAPSDDAPEAEQPSEPAEPAEQPSDAPEGDGDAPADEAIPVGPIEDTADDDDDDADAAAGGAAAGGAAAGGAAAGGAGGAGGAGAGAGAGGAGAGGAGSGGAGAGGSGSGSGAAVQRPGGGAVQQPSGKAQQPQQPKSGARQNPGATTQPTTPAPAEGPAPAAEPEQAPEQEPEAKDEKEPKNLGGFRLFRVGIAAKIGYMHGTSDKNGLYDRDKSIQDSIDNMMVTMSGAGDLGTTKFGGGTYGFILDAEVVGINLWFDFNKFFSPGGNWAVLLGYDHEFGFAKRLRLDIGVAGGVHKAFLGSALSGLYYDKDNPAAVNIGTLGVEGRAMADLHIKIVGPLFTGPYAMLGYHYLWSANVAEVTAEKGLHYGVGWTVRLDFAAPKLLGRRK